MDQDFKSILEENTRLNK